MDTSAQYIAMCREAWVIQREWQPVHGDYYYGEGRAYTEYTKDNSAVTLAEQGVYLCLETDSEGGHFHLEPEHILEKGKENFIWLLRQDQLQEMISSDCLELYCKLEYFMNRRVIELFTSMEQVLLAIIMEEKYNKTWDGKQKVLVKIK